MRSVRLTPRAVLAATLLLALSALLASVRFFASAQKPVVAEAGSTLGDEIVWRLVDAPASDAPAARLEETPPAPRGPARATINDDMRYTFARPQLQLVHRNAFFRIPADDQFTLELLLPAELRSCESLLALVLMNTLTTHDERWVVASCAGAAVSGRATLRVPVSAELRGRAVDLWVQARPLTERATSERRFKIAAVPQHARLAFAYGIESPGWEPDAAAVTFEVQAEGEAAPFFSARLDPARNPSDRRWLSADVDLGARAGRNLTLVLRTALESAKDRRPFSLPVWSNPTLIARAANRRTPPWNVLLVSLDTLRARSLGAYGRERPTSPFFDRLAGEGALFERTVVQSTSTPQSHMSLFTSLYPSTHGVTDLNKGSDLAAYTTLAEILRKAGYATGAVTEDGLLQAALGFERGFDGYAENKSPKLAEPVGDIETTFREAKEWMARHRAQPFFLFVHTYQVHDPYTPPPSYQALFGDKSASGPSADLDRYEEEIRYADDQLAHLWSEVGALGLGEHTLLIVLSDHGEEFGEHGMLRHGSDLYDETLLVPLLMRAPGLIPEGLRVPQQAALIDVLPTVLDLLGLPPAPQAQGLSLAGLFRDEPARAKLAAALDERPVYAEAWANFHLFADGRMVTKVPRPTLAQRTRDLKVVRTPADPASGREARIEAYDLSADPLERQNIAQREDARIPAGREALEHYLASGPAHAGAEAAPVAPDAATLEKLRALGYVD